MMRFRSTIVHRPESRFRMALRVPIIRWGLMLLLVELVVVGLIVGSRLIAEVVSL